MPDRFSNPEAAEAATLAAAQESENAASIDETVEDDVMQIEETIPAEPGDTVESADAEPEDAEQDAVEPAAEENGENA